MTDTSTEAVKALLNYQQADEEGVMVLASRQAIHEVVDALAAAEAPRRVEALEWEKIEEIIWGHADEGTFAYGANAQSIVEEIAKAVAACLETVPQDAIAKAREEERERAAKIVENWIGHFLETSLPNIAKSIRSQGEG